MYYSWIWEKLKDLQEYSLEKCYTINGNKNQEKIITKQEENETYKEMQNKRQKRCRLVVL